MTFAALFDDRGYNYHSYFGVYGMCSNKNMRKPKYTIAIVRLE